MRELGEEAVRQEVLIAVVRAAQLFDPTGEYAGVPFGAFASVRVRGCLLNLLKRQGTKAAVWKEMPTSAEDGASPDPADYREPERGRADRLMGEWHDPDFTEQRRALDWTERVLLFLRTVEGLTLTEAGACFGLGTRRTQLIEEEAGRKLAAFRVRRRAGRHEPAGV